MGLLEGKNALVFGVANDHSIAWGIAQALHAEGATVGFSSIESLIDKRVRPLADSIGATFVEPADVQSDADIERVFARWGETTDHLDILVHALAFAKREDLEGGFVDTSRDGFALALDVSAYSLVALTRAARPYLRRGSSVMTLDPGWSRGRAARTTPTSEYADTSIASAKPSRDVSTNAPSRSSRFANARAWTRMSRWSWYAAQRAKTRSMSASFWTSHGSTNVEPIESARGWTRFSISDSIELNPTSAPASWSARAIPQAIEWSLATPKISAFLRSRSPMPVLRWPQVRGMPGG